MGEVKKVSILWLQAINYCKFIFPQRMYAISNSSLSSFLKNSAVDFYAEETAYHTLQNTPESQVMHAAAGQPKTGKGV